LAAPAFTGWLVAFFTRKIAVAAATLASFVLLTAAFVVCIKTMIVYVLTLAVMPPILPVLSACSSRSIFPCLGQYSERAFLPLGLR